MALASWFGSWKKSRMSQSPRRLTSPRLRVEALEERRVLTSSAGSLHSILVMSANDNTEYVKSALASSPLLTGVTIDTFNSYTGTPTLAQLQQYDAVLNFTNYPPTNPSALGNVLADYVDGGGGLVLATFSFSSPW